MKAAQLLASSKSFVGMKDHNSPYKMRTTNLLPNFGAKKNPFAASSAVAVEEEHRWDVPEPKVHAQVASEDSLSLFDADLKPVAQPLVEPVISAGPSHAMKPMAPAICEDRAILVRGTTDSAVALAPFKPVKESPKEGFFAKLLQWGGVGRTAKAPERKPVQCELALAKITVKRNSLHQSDLRVVAKAPTAGFAEQTSQQLAEQPTRKGPSRVGGSLLRFLALGQLKAR